MGAAGYMKDSFTENLVRRTPGLYRRFAGLVRRAETFGLSERLRLRDELTARTLRKAASTPYARKFGLSGEFGRWPVLEKATLVRQPGVCVAPTLVPSRPAATGGTSGTPIALRRSLSSVVFEQVVVDRLVQRHSGLDLKRARVAVLRGDAVKSPDDMKPPHWRVQGNGMRLVCSSHHLNAATVDDFIEAIRRFDPEILWVYPSSLEALIRLGAQSLAARPLPRLRLVLASSEALPATIAAEASDLLGVPVLDYYGQSERVCASWSVLPGEHWFMPAYGRAELVHAHDDGDWSLFEILGTSFWNAAQPLVRFRTGDLARLPKGLSAAEIEEVTLGVRPFAGIEGRCSEYVVTPEGRHLHVLSQIPRNVPGVAQMQIVQRQPTRIEIHVVPLQTFCDKSLSVILANARQKIPAGMEIDFRIVQSVMRTAMGKVPLVMRLPD